MVNYLALGVCLEKSEFPYRKNLFVHKINEWLIGAIYLRNADERWATMLLPPFHLSGNGEDRPT